jgi:hypothetical protein
MCEARVKSKEVTDTVTDVRWSSLDEVCESARVRARAKGHAHTWLHFAAVLRVFYTYSRPILHQCFIVMGSLVYKGIEWKYKSSC